MLIEVDVMFPQIAFIFKSFVSFTEDCTLQSEIYVIHYTMDLTQYLTNISNYDYAEGNSSKLAHDASDNSVQFKSTVTAMRNEVFCSKNKYVLEFDWKLSRGYDGGFIIGTPTDYLSFTQQSSLFQLQHGRMNSDSYYGGTVRINSSARFTSYVHVKITRNENTFNINVNNGQIIMSFTAQLENQFGGRCWSGTSYIKNLKVTY